MPPPLRLINGGKRSSRRRPLLREVVEDIVIYLQEEGKSLILEVITRENIEIEFFIDIEITIGGVAAECYAPVVMTGPGVFRFYLKPAKKQRWLERIVSFWRRRPSSKASKSFFEGLSPDGRPRLEIRRDGSYRKLPPAVLHQRIIVLKKGDDTFMRCIARIKSRV